MKITNSCCLIFGVVGGITCFIIFISFYTKKYYYTKPLVKERESNIEQANLVLNDQPSARVVSDTLQANLESSEEPASNETLLPLSVNRESNDQLRHTAFLNTSTIYFSVKTNPRYYKARLDVLRATWFQVVERDKLSVVSDYTDDGFHDEKIFEKEFIKEGFHLNLANCSVGHGRLPICCKSGLEYKLFYDYLNHTKGQNQIRWYCHFDDDIYVNVKELLKLLSQYNSSKPYLIGRNPRGPEGARLDGMRWNLLKKHFNGRINTYVIYPAGAAYCVSKPLMKELHRFFGDPEVYQDTCRKISTEDDLTIGCILESVLNYHLTSIDKFNIETTDLEELKKMSVADLAKMITVSFQTINKQNPEKITNLIDPQSSKFTPLQDPTRFLTYHCLLFNETSWCEPGSDSPLKYRDNPQNLNTESKPAQKQPDG